MSDGANIVRTQLELQKHADAREDAVEALVSDYHSRIARSALTVISALIAVIGFLINSQHLAYISRPDVIRVSLYGALILFSAVFLLEMINARVTAIYASSVLKRKAGRHAWLITVKTVRLVNEILCILGVIFLAIFAWLLLHNVIG